jgi:hypothetical protein
MVSFISTIQNIFTALLDTFLTGDCNFGLADYKDIPDGGDYATGWKVDANFTNDKATLLTAINGLFPSGGGDAPEEQIYALDNAALQWETIGGSPTSSGRNRIIIWAGDVPGHVAPDVGFESITLAGTISDLISAEIKVFALSSGASGGGLDGNSQASDICTQTNGKLFNNVSFSSFNQIKDVLCQIFQKIS